MSLPFTSLKVTLLRFGVAGRITAVEGVVALEVVLVCDGPLSSGVLSTEV